MEYQELINGYFTLEIDGDDDAQFKTCSGLNYELEIVTLEQVDITGRRYYKKRPGRINYGDIEFERGLVPSKKLDDLLKQAERGLPGRWDAAIKLYNEVEDDKKVVAQWNLAQAWISGWSLVDLDSTDDEVLIQTLRITHEGMTRVDPG